MKISLCASALRPAQWLETYNSLTQNNIEWQIIYVGPNPPPFILPPNFKYIQSNVKPAQCYEIAFRAAQGELLGWTADDTVYPPNALDNMYNFWKSFNNEKIVAAFRTVEDGKDITDVHRFRGRDPNSPRMAPFGIMSTKLFHELGGYDSRFICGQSENDMVMRVYEIGGELKISDISVFVDHQKAHDSGTAFRSGFFHEDRKVLESAWVRNDVVQSKRLCPVESFSNENICIITQSQKGKWQ